MKKQADNLRLKKEFIKQQKNQSNQMESHIERLIKMLDKLLENENLPKMLYEDIEWAVNIISENKLYSGSHGAFKYNKDRDEILAWLEKINLK